MPRTKKDTQLSQEEISKKIANKTHDFLAKELGSFVNKNKYNESGEDLFAVACSTVAYAADLLARTTDLEPQEIFSYLSDAVAQTLDIEMEYLEEDDYTKDDEADKYDYPPPTTDKKLLN
jgi:hypothetical protein